jgi:hypothetical protein
MRTALCFPAFAGAGVFQHQRRPKSTTSKPIISTIM